MIALPARIFALLIAGAFAFSLPARAMDSPTPAPEPPKTQSDSTHKPGTKSSKKKKPKKQDRSELQFINGYKVAHSMIYKRHEYEIAIAKLKSLGHDDNPDVANLLGYASRKSGHYEDSKYWYDRALAADPKHTITWSYYGAWYAEQGNLLKAKEYLAKVASLCGNTNCREYTMLKGVIDGTRTY